MTKIAQPIQHNRPARNPRTQLHRLLRRHDELANRIATHRSHGLPTTDLWIALVRLEDHLRDNYPRAYTTHLPTWLQRQAPGTHPIGRRHPACPLCTTGTAQLAARTGQPR